MNRIWLATAVMVTSVAGCRCLVPVEELPYDFDAKGIVEADSGVPDSGVPETMTPDAAGPTTVIVQSSTEWLATGTQPPSGWTTLGFNAQWPHAQLNSGTSEELPFPGMWDGPTVVSGSPQVWYRRVFTLNGEIESAELFLVCNDDMTVYINGVNVLEEHDGISTWSHVDVSAAVEPGENVIAATCRDMIPPEHAFHARLTAVLR